MNQHEAKSFIWKTEQTCAIFRSYLVTRVHEQPSDIHVSTKKIQRIQSPLNRLDLGD
ncbi:hypothetical protein [Paenibacillus pabuli]|uniref:hypothetical protein n=1 Tax=Paenibacillus pabuli TaxID=1472 RepID=UPI003CEBD004